MASNFDEHGGVPGVEFTSPVLTAVYGQSRWIFKQLLRACALAQWLKDTPVAATSIDAAFTAYQAQANGLSTLAKTVSALAKTHKCPVSMWKTSIIWSWNGFLSRKETCAQRFDRTSAFLGA